MGRDDFTQRPRLGPDALPGAESGGLQALDLLHVTQPRASRKGNPRHAATVQPCDIVRNQEMDTYDFTLIVEGTDFP